MPCTCTCELHGIPLVCYCPACRGATGGQVSSPAKVAASRENAAKARQASQAKRRIPGDASAPDRPP